MSHIIGEGAGDCRRTHRGLIITNDLHVFLHPRAAGNTEKQSRLGLTEEAQPCYQTHFSLFTMSACTMPAGRFFPDGNKPKQIKFLQRVILAVSGQWLADQRGEARAKVHQRHNSKQFLLPQGAPPSYIFIFFFKENDRNLNSGRLLFLAI